MFTPYHAMYAARCLLLAGQGEATVTTSLSTARVEMKPHQVDAAIFALQSPLARGAILADETGLGKTIEGTLVIAQRWAERRRRILLIVPASIRKQWAEELRTKFKLAAIILEARSYAAAVREGRRPLEPTDRIVLMSYEYAAARADDLETVPWDLVVFDEAHRLRNVYKALGAARARKLRDALAPRFKLLLTATPLQNALLELYGLVSMIDGDLFGDEKSFRLLYGNKPDAAALASLRERLAPICKRHLRRDVQAAGHVSFTERRVLTLDFEPADQEVRLYEVISAYLMRPSTAAFGDPPNTLVLTVARKILGSSTAAIVRFLETILRRLRARQALDLRALSDFDDVEGLVAASSEAGADPLIKDYAGRANVGWTGARGDRGKVRAPKTSNPLDPTGLADEIDEVESYHTLARSLGTNAKGERLVASLPTLLDDVERKGGARKVVIFTEFVRTQRYLADILAQGGHAGRIVLLNGSNSDSGSKLLYQAWLARHAGTDAISGSRSADMKAALVEAFRNDGSTILIATESGAEGINLQFCSLLINFDLPWNPQRVEQRIGRCHRYGQRLDVTVVNFLNRRNKAELRVYELLNAKFRLFEGVVGASEGVLGVIAPGVDFERAVLAILQSCRTDVEIEEAFTKLEGELDERIAADMKDARRKLFDNMDQGVIARLQARGEAIGRGLGEVEQHLITVARVELPDACFHDAAHQHADALRFGSGHVGSSFEHAGSVWTTDWPTAEARGWRFFRLGDGELASELVERAQSRDLPIGHVAFRPEALKALGVPGYADVNRLKGQAGWLRVSRLTLGTPAEADRPREASVLAAITDDDEALPFDTIEHLLRVPGEDRGRPNRAPPNARLDALERAHEAARIEEARAQNGRWLDEENDRLDAQAADLLRAADEKAKALEAEARSATRALRGRSDLTHEARLEEQRRIKGIEDQHDRIMFTSFTRRNKLRGEARANLDKVADSLAITPVLERLFTIRWQVVD